MRHAQTADVREPEPRPAVGLPIIRNIVRFTSAPSAVKWRKTDNSGDLGMSLNSSNHLAMDAIIDFAAGQTFGAFSYPDATTTSKGIVQIDPVGGLAVMAGVLSLANTAVTPGTYPKLTVDAKGRATAGAALVAGDLPAHTHVATDIVSGALPFTIQKAGTAIGTRRAARLRITCSPRRIRTPWPPRPSWAT